MPPSRYLGLGYPEWGETDLWLRQGYKAFLRADPLCGCGCGELESVAHDPATDGRWQVTEATCFKRAALIAYQKDHPDLTPDAMLGAELLPPGQVPIDRQTWDPEMAADIYAAHMAKYDVTT